MNKGKNSILRYNFVVKINGLLLFRNSEVGESKIGRELPDQNVPR